MREPKRSVHTPPLETEAIHGSRAADKKAWKLRGLVGLATMLVLVAVVTVPALARGDQAAEQVVDRAQGAVEKGEDNAVSQAIDQAHNNNQSVDPSSVRAGGSFTGVEAVFFILGSSILSLIVGALAYGIFRGSINHTYGGSDSSVWRMRRRG